MLETRAAAEAAVDISRRRQLQAGARRQRLCRRQLRANEQASERERGREIKSDCVQLRHMAGRRRRRLGAGNGVRACVSRGVSVHVRRFHPGRRADSRRCHMPSSAKPYGSSCATRLSRRTTQQRAVSLYSAQRAAVRTYILSILYGPMV